MQPKLLPSCMDLVVWGHEHECTIEGGMNAITESADVRHAQRAGPCRGGGARGSGAAGHAGRSTACTEGRVVAGTARGWGGA